MVYQRSRWADVEIDELPFSDTHFFSSILAAAAQLPPTHDYGIVGNAGSHTKFSVAQDGRVRLANFSIFSPTDQGPNVTGGVQPGVLLFNPQDHLGRWPQSGNFSAYKTSIVGRHTRAVVLAAWDAASESGFSLTAVPNTRRGMATLPYDMAELLVRLEAHTMGRHGVTAAAPLYFAVQGCVVAASAVDRAAVNGTSGNELCSTPTQCKPAVRCHGRVVLAPVASRCVTRARTMSPLTAVSRLHYFVLLPGPETAEKGG